MKGLGHYSLRILRLHPVFRAALFASCFLCVSVFCRSVWSGLFVSPAGRTLKSLLQLPRVEVFVLPILFALGVELGVRFAAIRRPVGASLSSLADFLYARKTRERVFDPIIADMREEWCEAMAKKRTVKAAFIRARGVYSFSSAVLAHGLGSVLKTAYGIFKATR